MGTQNFFGWMMIGMLEYKDRQEYMQDELKWKQASRHTHTDWCVIVAAYKGMVGGCILINLAKVHRHISEGQWVWVKDKYCCAVQRKVGIV